MSNNYDEKTQICNLTSNDNEQEDNTTQQRKKQTTGNSSYNNSESTIRDAAQDDAAQGPETSAVSASSPNPAQEVTKRDEGFSIRLNAFTILFQH